MFRLSLCDYNDAYILVSETKQLLEKEQIMLKND